MLAMEVAYNKHQGSNNLKMINNLLICFIKDFMKMC